MPDDRKVVMIGKYGLFRLMGFDLELPKSEKTEYYYMLRKAAEGYEEVLNPVKPEI